MTEKFVYVGRKPCGCVAGIATDYGDKGTARSVADFITSGLRVTCVPWSQYLVIAKEETFLTCPHGQLRLQLEVKL